MVPVFEAMRSLGQLPPEAMEGGRGGGHGEHDLYIRRPIAPGMALHTTADRYAVVVSKAGMNVFTQRANTAASDFRRLHVTDEPLPEHHRDRVLAMLHGQPVPVGCRLDRAAVQVHLPRRERGQPPGSFRWPVIEAVRVVEVQFEQDLDIVVAGPQSLQVPLDLDERRGQGVGRRCVGEMRGQR